MRILEHRSPLDDSERVVELQSFDVEQICEKWLREYRMDVSRCFGDTVTFTLCEGVNTALRYFAPTHIAGDSAFYEGLQRFDWYYLQKKWEHLVALRLVGNCQRVLEIGCGSGHFLQLMKGRGIHTVEGWELNAKAVSEGLGLGRPVLEKDVFATGTDDQAHWDAVCCFQVLEHVPSPREFVAACINLMKPGGLLVFAVPDDGAFLASDEDNLLNLPPHHISRWSLRSLASLGRLFGLTLVYSQREPLAAVHVEWIVRLLIRRASSQTTFWHRLVFNRAFGYLAPLALKLGGRRLVRGQSLLVAFRRP